MNRQPGYPGTYNARRDNPEGYWKGQFGYSHGLIIVNAFYEHVSQPTGDDETQNVILEFKPRPVQNMMVACDLLLFEHQTVECRLG